MIELLSRDSFYASEIEIFKAVVDWISANNVSRGPELDNVLSTVRLPLISIQDLLTEVRPLNYVSSEALLDAISLRTIARDNNLRHRGVLSKLHVKNIFIRLIILVLNYIRFHVFKKFMSD